MMDVLFKVLRGDTSADFDQPSPFPSLALPILCLEARAARFELVSGKVVEHHDVGPRVDGLDRLGLGRALDVDAERETAD